MIIDAVATYAQRSPNKVACVDLETDRRWSYLEFHQRVNQVANWLVERLGKRSGARVATVTRNSAEMLILNFACIRAGAIFVPTNWRLSPAELAVILGDAGVSIVFKNDEFELPVLEGVDTFSISQLLVLTKEYAVSTPANASQALDEPSTLLYTSGTSGRPKGVKLSEMNVFWSIYNFSAGNNAWSHSVFLCDMPLFHTAGLLANTRSAFLVGGTALISSAFDVEKTLARLSDVELGVTHYFSVPQMAQMLWNHPEFKPELLQKLEVYATGGAPNSKAQIERFIGAGIKMSDGFGMSETGSVTGMPVSDGETVVNKAGSCGTLYVGVEARIIDEQGAEVGSGQPGELLLRGPGITSGYWNQPELSEKAFVDGWFMTGDIAVCDEDGFYYLVDRKKDMFISGGENVYPAEVEAAISEIHDIAEVAVVGCPDEKWGEVGVAVVVPVSGKVVEPEDVVAHCIERLAKYKVPKKVIISDTIPRNSTGKVQKQILLDVLKT